MLRERGSRVCRLWNHRLSFALGGIIGVAIGWKLGCGMPGPCVEQRFRDNNVQVVSTRQVENDKVGCDCKCDCPSPAPSRPCPPETTMNTNEIVFTTSLEPQPATDTSPTGSETCAVCAYNDLNAQASHTQSQSTSSMAAPSEWMIVIVGDAHLFREGGTLYSNALSWGCYGNRWGVPVRAVDPRDVPSCAGYNRLNPKMFFFWRLCAMAKIVESLLVKPRRNTHQRGLHDLRLAEAPQWILHVDGDSAPFNGDVSLHDLMKNWGTRDMIFYERFRNGEVMAGNYVARVSWGAARFLREWEAWQAVGDFYFGNWDNGALHLQLVKHLAPELAEFMEPHDVFDKLENLWLSSSDLKKYDRYVAAVKLAIGPRRAFKRVLIQRRGHGFCIDNDLYGGSNVLLEQFSSGDVTRYVCIHGEKERLFASGKASKACARQVEDCKAFLMTCQKPVMDPKSFVTAIRKQSRIEFVALGGVNDVADCYPNCPLDIDSTIWDQMKRRWEPDLSNLAFEKRLEPAKRRVANDVTAVSNNPPLDSQCEWKKRLDANARAKIKERSEWIFRAALRSKFGQDISYERKAFGSMRANNFPSALLLSPYYPCLWTLEKTASVADHFDGGKWLCGFRELAQTRPDACIVYSIGSDFDNTFEMYISKGTNGKCNIHTYDPTMSRNKDRLASWVKNLPPNMHFHEVGIADEGVKIQNIASGGMTREYPSMTLLEAFRQNGHSAGVDILKFDIESHEYELLEGFDWKKLKIGLILFEYHNQQIHDRVHRGSRLQDLHRQLERMETAGYRLYSIEPVCSSCTGQFEVTLMHRDWEPHCGFECRCAND